MRMLTFPRESKHKRSQCNKYNKDKEKKRHEKKKNEHSEMIHLQVHLQMPCYDFYFL